MIRGQIVVAGEAKGLALVSREPLSFWGGYEQKTGEIIDRRHPLSGHNGAGRVLALPCSRGSSTTTAVLLEAVRLGTAPSAIITSCVDHFFALASIVADELYAKPIPIVALSTEDFALLQSGQQIQINPDGTLFIADRSASSAVDSPIVSD